MQCKHASLLAWRTEEPVRGKNKNLFVFFIPTSLQTFVAAHIEVTQWVLRLFNRTIWRSVNSLYLLLPKCGACERSLWKKRYLNRIRAWGNVQSDCLICSTISGSTKKHITWGNECSLFFFPNGFFFLGHWILGKFHLFELGLQPFSQHLQFPGIECGTRKDKVFWEDEWEMGLPVDTEHGDLQATLPLTFRIISTSSWEVQ